MSARIRIAVAWGFAVVVASVAIAAHPATELAQLPLQEGGRIKPLDTFARTHLLAFNGKQSLEELDAITWLMELVCDQHAAHERQVFDIRNPEVADALGLERREHHRYSFQELFPKLREQSDDLAKLHRRDPQERTLVENQLVELYLNTLRFHELSRVFSCLRPQIEVPPGPVAGSLGLTVGSQVSYFDLSAHNDQLRALIAGMQAHGEGDEGSAREGLVQLAHQVNQLLADQDATALAVIPPPPGSSQELWASPWELMGDRGSLAPSQIAALEAWQGLLAAYAASSGAIEERVAQARAAVASAHPHDFDPGRLSIEVGYNRAQLYYKSIALYIAAFLLIITSWLFKPGITQKLAFGALALGLIPHLIGMGLRMHIMGRPPVSTLYESILFVGLIAVLTSVVVEGIQRTGVATFVGSLSGAALHFLGFSYAADGDTMGMLVAVLNSNFWLATHVVTITIGYGASLVAGIVGHYYLVYHILKPEDGPRLSTINGNMVGLTLVALFFTLFGTILGGIWADQSWGRFWGWDPKENGALLIVLWQVALLHGRLSGQFKPLGMAAGLVLNNIIVILAWFGVNLLSVGLHTYGNTGNVAINVATFCALEVAFGVIAYSLARMRARPLAPSGG